MTQNQKIKERAKNLTRAAVALPGAFAAPAPAHVTTKPRRMRARTAALLAGLLGLLAGFALGSLL